MKDDKKFLELINSLQKDKELFFNGVLHYENEKIFIEYVENLNSYLKYIDDTTVKLKVDNFVNTIKKNKNYELYKKEEKVREEAKQKELERIKKLKEEERQRELEREKTRKARLEQQKQRELEIEKARKARLEQQKQATIIVDQLKQLRLSGDFNELNLLYKQHEQLLKMYYLDFCKKWERLPFNMDIKQFPYCCKAILEKRKIKYLVHFTNIKNLQSILENSLCPVSYLKTNKINYINNDTQRLDKKLDCISLSIEYPNSYMLKTYMNKNRFCLLILNAQKVLLYNNCTKYYLYCNAARNDASQWLETEVLSRDCYIENMFMEHNPDTREHCQYSRSEKGIKDYLPTNVQAEILFKGIISSAYVESIIFQTQDDLDLCKEMISNKELFDKYTLIVDRKYFGKREDFPWEDR